MRPFQNIIGDPEQEYVADGMVDDIITVLPRFATAYANVSDAPLRSQEVIRRCIRALPSIRRADRKTRAEFGQLKTKQEDMARLLAKVSEQGALPKTSPPSAGPTQSPQTRMQSALPPRRQHLPRWQLYYDDEW